MKNKTALLTVVLAGLAFSAQSAPKDNTWYAGGKLGVSSFYRTSFDHNRPSNDEVSSNKFGVGAYGGYQFNPYIGAEIGWDWLGRMRYSGDGSKAPGAKGTGSFKSHGFQFAAKLSYPIPFVQDLDVYTRLGFFWWRSDTHTVVNGVYNSNWAYGLTPMTAVGVEYAITPSIATRLDYQFVYRIGDRYDLGARPDNGFVSAGVSYRFGQ